MSKKLQKWFMHVDMDAFYASIEQKDHPELRGKPVIVGGGGPRGVVSAASYEIRKFGVHSAMPIAQALQLCPHAILVPVRMARYAEVSRTVIDVLRSYSPRVEKASVDEAYLDATGLERLFGPVHQTRSEGSNRRIDLFHRAGPRQVSCQDSFRSEQT